LKKEKKFGNGRKTKICTRSVTASDKESRESKDNNGKQETDPSRDFIKGGKEKKTRRAD